MKTHWKKLTNPNYIGAYDFAPNEERVVKIISVQREMVNSPDGSKEECIVAKLEGSKPLILNKTNCKTITKVHESPYIEDWQNITIKLYVAKVKAFGEVVDALRIRQEKPTFKKQELTPQHPRWAGAIKALADGNTTLQEVLKTFDISPENQKLLCSK